MDRPISTIKELVSKRRKRYTQDGFNLDLAYITPRVIAMGFPAEKVEGLYRNHIDDVKRFLDTKHKNQYKVYNLCSERKYDLCRFEHVERYPFDDHNPPKIQLIKDFCDDVHKWLTADNNNVAAVHCKAGKGRTGTMICCYLLYAGEYKSAADALLHYAQKRTHDAKGVTIPSQRRYVEYYSYLLKSGKMYNPVAMQICEIKLYPPPLIYSHQGTISYSISTTNSKKHYAPGPQFKKQDSCVTIRLDVCIPLDGDIKIDFFWNKMLKKEKLFHFWFNTFFVDELADVLPDGSLSYKLRKCELDDAHKDKAHKTYSEDFMVEVILQKIPCGPFAKPRSIAFDNNTNNCNNSNNHNILTQQNNISPTNGQTMYTHHHRNQYHRHHMATNNTFNNYRPPIIASGGPCSAVDGGIDHVDSSNNSNCRNMEVLNPNPMVDMQIPSETSETSSSSEPSSSSEEWESGECCNHIIYSNYKIDGSSCSNYSDNNNKQEMQANNSNKQLDVMKCGVLNLVNSDYNCSDNIEECDDNSKKLIHLDYLDKKLGTNEMKHGQESRNKTHYSDDNYYLGSSVSLAAAVSIPSISSSQNNTESHLSTTSASPPTKILTQRKKFKAKTDITVSGKKIRWLANMKSDPDFRETLNKNVHFRPSAGLSPVRTSNDSLNSDYYSSICDKQLSFGSPAKSPSELTRLARVQESTHKTECSDIVVANKKKTPPIPEFRDVVPPNTPTTPYLPNSAHVTHTTADRKSPAKLEPTSFKQRFFNFTRREHEHHVSPNKIDQISILTMENEISGVNKHENNIDSVSSQSKASSKFSFRDLKHEIQSAIKSHHQHNNNRSSSTSSNGKSSDKSMDNDSNMESNENKKSNSDKKPSN
uniref:Phosphatidylinositol 3,4,5-trisphosphate 3-phosphatase and dual-specificity protein phosphatase PTEN n=1 Tax=Culicoides sonorensis TaxID=179676 RepID=A0A336LPS5_CULSO